jgi:Mn2+/Fe2+ NRAMP family transporter
MVGTTVASVLFIVRTTLVKEAGWTIKDLHIERRDAAVSALMMFIISGSIMAAAAGTLYVSGVGLSKASQMIELLKPLAGRFAVSIFVFGIVAAGVSSQFPNVLLLPWLLCDYNQSKRDMKLPRYRVIVFFISLLGLVVPVFHAKPVVVMIASQAFGALLLPATVLSIIYLGNRKDVMGKKYVNKFGTNIILGLIFIFSLYMCGSGIKGLLGTIF